MELSDNEEKLAGPRNYGFEGGVLYLIDTPVGAPIASALDEPGRGGHRVPRRRVHH